MLDMEKSTKKLSMSIIIRYTERNDDDDDGRTEIGNRLID